MCLDVAYKKRPPKTGVGWKIFTRVDYTYSFKYRQLNGTFLVPTDVWLTAENKNIHATYGLREYPSGFHIYLDKPDGIVVVRVKYRNGHTYGRQDGLRIVVASEMFVPAQKKKSTTVRKVKNR